MGSDLSSLAFPVEMLCKSPQETEHVAAAFAATLTPGAVVALYGDLGAGKTFFATAICEYFETQERATSPTFTIMNQYHGRDNLTIYHFDFYRLEHQAELVNLGLDEFFYGESICLIEWPEKIDGHLPGQYYAVHLSQEKGNQNGRTIRIERHC